MNLRFTENDYERMKALTDAQLYVMDAEVMMLVAEIQRNLFNVLLNETLICEATMLVEDVAREVARRKGFGTEKSFNPYIKADVSYDTDEHQAWLRLYLNVENLPGKDFLKEFSFYEDLRKIVQSQKVVQA